MLPLADTAADDDEDEEVEEDEEKREPQRWYWFGVLFFSRAISSLGRTELLPGDGGASVR